MVHGTILRSKLAKPQIVVGTILRSPIASWYDMPVNTFVPLLAITICEIVTTGRNFVLLVTVQIVTVVTLFAVAFQVMDADDLFVFTFICFQVLRFVQGDQLVET